MVDKTPGPQGSALFLLQSDATMHCLCEIFSETALHSARAVCVWGSPRQRHRGLPSSVSKVNHSKDKSRQKDGSIVGGIMSIRCAQERRVVATSNLVHREKLLGHIALTTCCPYCLMARGA